MKKVLIIGLAITIAFIVFIAVPLIPTTETYEETSERPFSYGSGVGERYITRFEVIVQNREDIKGEFQVVFQWNKHEWDPVNGHFEKVLMGEETLTAYISGNERHTFVYEYPSAYFWEGGTIEYDVKPPMKEVTYERTRTVWKTLFEYLF